jgi:hypothetical protein
MFIFILLYFTLFYFISFYFISSKNTCYTNYVSFTKIKGVNFSIKKDGSMQFYNYINQLSNLKHKYDSSLRELDYLIKMKDYLEK